MTGVRLGEGLSPPMAAAASSFKTKTENSENAQEKSLGRGSGDAAAGLGRRRRRGRKGHRRWRSKKKFQIPEEFLTLEVGFLKVWWKEKCWRC